MTQKMTDAELAEIQHLLQTAYCNPVWRKHISALVAEVNRLRSAQPSPGDASQFFSSDDDAASANDTVVL